VQQLYACNKGTHTLPLTMNGRNVTGAEGQNGLFASAVLDKNTREYIVKVVNTSGQTQPVMLRFAGLKKNDTLSGGKCIKLRADSPEQDNTLEAPHAITPEENAIATAGQMVATELEPHTFAIYKFTLSN
jgi:alpha-L-arabinofuranosidase